MSRIIEQIATVQFQVQTRQASATMQALQEAAKDLAKDMDSVNEKIAALGKDVPEDNPQLLNYQNMLRSIKKDYDDVMKAQRDFMRGAKAADQLWKAAQEQNIESLSFRSIKSGISGLRKRQEGLSAGDAKDMQDWRIIQNVIQEADRIVKEATADVQNTIQVIRDGGKVSEQAMRQTISALRDLRSSVDETDADFHKWGSDLDFMEGKLKDFTDAQRRAKGEMVDANDARKEMEKLTKAGAEAAEESRKAAEKEIKTLEEKGKTLAANREEIKKNIEATRKEIDEQHKLIEKKHSELAAAEEARKIVFDADRAHIEGLQTQARKERALANEKSDAAEKQMRYTELLEQQTDTLGQKVVSLQEKLAKMNEPVKPKVDASELEQIERKLKNIANLRKEQQKIIDDYEAKYGKTSDEQYEARRKIELEASQKDVAAQEAAIEKVNKKWDDFWKKQEAAAQEFARSLGKSLDEISPEDITSEQLSGPLAKSAQAAYKVTARRDYEFSEALGREGKLTEYKETARRYEGDDSPEAKVIESLTRKYREYVKELNEATTSDAEAKKVRAELREESDAYISALGQMQGFQKVENGLLQQKEAILKQSADAQSQKTAATKEENQATETQEELEGQLTETQKQHKASQEQLNKEREKSAKLQGEAIEQDNKAAAAEGKVADATKETTDAQAKYNIEMKEGLQDVKNMENAQTDMQIKLDGQEKQLKENGEAYSQNAQDITAAEAKKKQAQELTIQRMEEMKALLEQENRETVPANTEKWRENEAEIERLDQKIREYKGEWMSLEEAQTFASKAGKDGFIATAQQLQQAQQAMERYRDTLIKTIQQKQRDGEVTDKEEQELAELEQQMKDLKFEQDNFNMSHKKMQDLLSEPTKATDLDELKAAIKRADGELHRMQNSLGENSKEYQEFAGQVKNAKNVLKEMEGQAKATASAWDKAWSRLKTYVGMYMGFNIVWSKFTATGGDLMDLSDKMGEVRKTTGFTADEVGKLSDNLAKLDTRTNLTGLMEFSSLAGSIGMKTQEQVQGFTEAANMLAVSLPEMGNEASRTLMKIADATGDLEKNGGNVRETLERVGSTIIALRANSAAAAGPITDFVSRVGAVGAQAGISIDKIAALGATVDALGGRVEMSATALSRMIPAIRNNTFEVAKAIGMTEKELKKMSGMEQMVAVFKALHDSAKGFDTSTEEGMNAMADSVEKALGRSTSMQEVMKQLNQQGARAGIVFGLLSQNVDKLEEQLNIAGEAYQKNTALMDEYNKMNDTTAAKWEKLKNQFEEFWVGDKTQKRLGEIIDGLRKIVDFITDNGPIATGLRHLLIYAALVKSQWAETIGNMIISLGKFVWSLRESKVAVEADTAAKVQNYTTTITLGTATEAAAVKTNLFSKAWGKLSATMKANVITAVAMALYYLYTVIDDAIDKTKAAEEEIASFNQSIAEEENALDKLFEPLKKSNVAQDERNKLITEINSKYSKYLGYMVSETANAIQLADAHALVAKRIREEAYERRIAEKEKQVQEEHSESVNTAYAGLESAVRGGIRGGANVQEVTDLLKKVVDNRLSEVNLVNYNVSGNPIDAFLGKVFGAPQFVASGKILDSIDGAIGRLVTDGKISREDVGNIRAALQTYAVEAKSQHNDIMGQTSNMRSDLRNIQGAIKTDLANNINTLVSKVATSVSNAVRQAQGNTPRQDNVPSLLQRPQGGGIPNLLGGGKTQSNGKWQNPWQQSYDTTPQQQAAPEGWKPNVNKKDVNAVRQFVQDQEALRGALEAGGQQIDEAQRRVAESWLLTDKELKEYKAIVEKADRGPGGGNRNPYGDYNKVTSPYSKWNGDDLVARRKEMLERVRALANGADVQAVLSEDAKFISEATRKNIKDTKQAIEWYNTERLKIQEALHAKHLTNTGDWMDPKKGGRKASKMVQDEIKYYLDELDAYYTDRKAKIQEARNDEQITEAEAWRRTLQNDAEWQQRRGELQELYTKKSEKVTKEEKDRILDILSERTGDSASYILKDIANTVKFIEKVGVEKGKPAMDRIWGDIDLSIEQAFLRQRNAIGKQMDAIAEIINKERPFNGITKNLQENLTKMGILQADFEKQRLALAAKGEDTKELDKKYEEDIPKRLAFILGEAENAWTTSVEEIMQRMADAGMTAWADEIRKSPKMQEALMAQLHNTYDQIQEAIKKEASLMKKQAENMWNNILLPGGDGKTTVKDAFEKAIAQLGLDQGRVSRANSLINAGPASERVADKLAIKQMKLQLTMQTHYFNLMKKQGQQRVDDLTRQIALAKEEKDIEKAKRLEQDKQHVIMSLRLATTKEQTTLLKQQEEIIAKTEESQARLYKELKEWADLLASSMQSLFEASNAGNAEYYNERARIALEGEAKDDDGNVKVERYVIIEDAGTSDAEAHYEELTELQKIEREREIEQQNAQAEAWKKVMDDINMKMNDMITDYMNSFLQNEALDANTRAILDNTAALYATMGGKASNDFTDAGSMARDKSGMALDASGNIVYPIQPTEGEEQTPLGARVPTREDWEQAAEGSQTYWNSQVEQIVNANEQLNEAGVQPLTPQMMSEEEMQAINDQTNTLAQVKMDAENAVAGNKIENDKKRIKSETSTDKQIQSSAQSTYAKMTAAMNMYGIAYQVMSNDNLSATQKFEMFAVQAAGQAAISTLTATMAESVAGTAALAPKWMSKFFSDLGPWAYPVIGATTALLGSLMGIATSKISKGKSEIAQATGASTSSTAKSISAGKLMTGMLTYGEGNVNEFTDPSSLTPGRSYNVDSADGRTYRAKYMGVGAKTHLTNGAEFHLVGERGREAIIDAHTTRLLQMDDTGIWQAIQTLYNGGSLRHSVMRRKGRGMATFADGNIDEFETMADGGGLMAGGAGFSPEQMMALQASIDRQSDLLERAMTDGIHAYFDVYGRGGLIDSYDTGKKTVTSHGEKY